jgi:hypothetical protein
MYVKDLLDKEAGISFIIHSYRGCINKVERMEHLRCRQAVSSHIGEFTRDYLKLVYKPEYLPNTAIMIVLNFD